jgi:hypothetical protein
MFLSKEIVKVNDQVVFILCLGTYFTILGGFGGIKNLNKEINPFQTENPPQISMSEPSSSSPDLNPSESSPNSWAKLECH